MKKIIICLLLSGAALHFHASAQPYFQPNSTPVSQSVFSPVEPGKQQCNVFFWLAENNRLWFDLATIRHLLIMPDVDSLIVETGKLLEPLLDSFALDGIIRRVEVDATRKPAIFRIINHVDRPTSYTKKEGELVNLKMDQDTVRIKFLQENGNSSFINLLVNNVSDIRSLQPNAGSESLKLIRDKLALNYGRDIKYSPRHAYYASFNLSTGAMVSPESDNYHAIRSGSDQLEITVLNPTLTYARGNAFTGLSMGASFNYAKVRGAEGSRLGIGLYWEPQFAFRNDSSGKIQTTRNDFLTLRFQETPNKGFTNFSLVKTFSLGYLIRNRGNYFENNTFRLGLLGAANGKLQIEPELYFNNFFKNVSPGLRLGLRLF